MYGGGSSYGQAQGYGGSSYGYGQAQGYGGSRYNGGYGEYKNRYGGYRSLEEDTKVGATEDQEEASETARSLETNEEKDAFVEIPEE